ncbi:hypothetical protein TYRP_009519 [Tyrophagus putrescentiae]|nr:hypothetical protein TYRP_009519 [Tyrophagus putrescentiae]
MVSSIGVDGNGGLAELLIKATMSSTFAALRMAVHLDAGVILIPLIGGVNLGPDGRLTETVFAGAAWATVESKT